MYEQTAQLLPARWVPLLLHNNHNDRRIWQGCKGLLTALWTLLFGQAFVWGANEKLNSLLWDESSVDCSSLHMIIHLGYHFMLCKTTMIAIPLQKPYHHSVSACMFVFICAISPFLTILFCFIWGCASESQLCGVYSPRVPRGSDRERHLPATDNRIWHRGTQHKAQSQHIQNETWKGDM